METKNPNTSFNWKIAGKAGDGVMVTAKLVAKIAKRQGLSAFNYLEYPSLIKGGHQTGQVLAKSVGEATCQKRVLDLLVLFNLKGFQEHALEISDHTLVVHNSDAGKLSVEAAKKCTGRVLELPFLQLLRENQLNFLAANMLALGVSVYLLGLEHKLSLKTIESEFSDKSKSLVNDNIKAFNLGFEYFSTRFKPMFSLPIGKDEKLLLTGNEAVGLGALAAGVQFYSAYPMTPTSGLLHYMAGKQKQYPLVVKHAEDEIGAINHVLGASYAGARAMTGTSGGGFALMVESVSFSSVAEIPLVILMGQRTGPATGLPTWTAQGDLSFVLSAGHGDTQRVILTPGTAEEHFELTKLAFDLAEEFQLPVFILSDKLALESYHTMIKPEGAQVLSEKKSVFKSDSTKNYLRYLVTESGVSPRSVPGQLGGMSLTNSYEHDQHGFATEDAQEVKDQVEKRARKLKALASLLPKPYLIGPARADITFISWGSTGLVMREVIDQLSGSNNYPTINAIQLPFVWPFPTQEFLSLVKNAKKLVIIEANQTAQLSKLIAQETGLLIKDKLLRYDGRPFYVEDILEYAK